MMPYVSPHAQLSRRGRRETNEDAVLAVSLADGRELLAVADGMGGHAAGEVASTTALRSLVTRLSAGAELPGAVEGANAAIVHLAGTDPALKGMGTTLVALLRTGTSYEVVNVGDSRAYLVSARRIEQITQDHSFLAEAVQSGQMTREAALRSPWRNALTRSLGVEARVRVDRFGPFPVAAERPYALLLCSDGLHKALSDRTIQEVVLSAGSARAAAEALVARALESGSDDNISVVIRDAGIFDKGNTRPVPRPDAGPPAQMAPRDLVFHPDAARGRSVSPLDLRIPAPPIPTFWASPPPARRASRRRRRLTSRRWDADRVLVALCASALLLWIAILFLDL